MLNQAVTIKEGIVIAKSGKDTIKVNITQKVRHKILKKLFTRSHKFLVHDPSNQAKIGDIVKIYPGRRISKNKSWHIYSKKAKTPIVRLEMSNIKSRNKGTQSGTKYPERQLEGILFSNFMLH